MAHVVAEQRRRTATPAETVVPDPGFGAGLPRLVGGREDRPRGPGRSGAEPQRQPRGPAAEPRVSGSRRKAAGGLAADGGAFRRAARAGDQSPVGAIKSYSTRKAR